MCLLAVGLVAGEIEREAASKIEPLKKKKESEKEKEKRKTAALTSAPRRRRAPSRSRSTRARSLSPASGRTRKRTRRGGPGNSTGLRWRRSEGRRGAAPQTTSSRPSSTHHEASTLTASVRCSSVFEGRRLFHGRVQSRLSALQGEVGIEGREGGWLAARWQQALAFSFFAEV